MTPRDSEVDRVLQGVAAAPALEPAGNDPPDLGDRYAIEKEIGRGGMGRVFVARDRRLGREVAIKVLAASAQGTDALRRFEQEARATALLEHPNIVVVHDVGNAAGAPYIVSELLRGRTLRHRLASGTVSVAEAIDWSRQLAAGLCAAHEKGIVHRDLKPENLFLTDEGRLKILDFGIAKLLQTPGKAGEAPTQPQTETGAILGTSGYMSPEQVRGEAIDVRSDIFSFGAILYEMLAGRAAFRRGGKVDTGYAILHDEPEPLPARVPLALGDIVRRCLWKNRDERFPSVRELTAALAQVTTPAAQARLPSIARSFFEELRRRRVFRALVAYGIAAFAILQIIEPVMHGLHWSDAVLTYVVIALAVGFPIVTSLAWIFDIKAGRIERTVAAGQTSTFRGAPLALQLLGIGVLAATPGLVWYFFARGTPKPETTASAVHEAAPAIVSSRATRILDLPPPRTNVPEAAADFAAAVQAIHDDNWMKGTALLLKAVEHDPTMAAAHLRLSIALLLFNNPLARRAEYERAAGLRAQLSERDLGLLEAMQPFLQSATQDTAETDKRLRALAARYPRDVELWMLLGLIHYATSAALAPAERAIELDPGDAQSWENRASALYATGKYAEARADLERCEAISVDSGECFLVMALAADMPQGRCADFERNLRRGVDRSPVWTAVLLFAMPDAGRSKAAMEETAAQGVAALPPAIGPEVIGAGLGLRLAVVDGDFIRAAAFARRESEMIMRDPVLRASYPRRYQLTNHLIEIALETGDARAARRLANDFAAHRDAWATEITWNHGVDLSLYFARLALPLDRPPPSSFELQRKAWIEQRLRAGADRGQVWDYAWASPAFTEREAKAALDALADLGPAGPTPEFTLNLSDRNGSPEADLGRIYLLAGRIDQAIDHMGRAVASCDLFLSTLDHVRAALNLGLAFERKGDTRGACNAYGKVLAQWGHARPRSVTADSARARIKALGCRQ